MMNKKMIKTMRDLKEININDGGGRPVKRLPPTDDMIKEFEDYFGVKLPREYIELLRFSNGGGPEVDCIKQMGDENAIEVAVNRFHYLDDKKLSYGNLWFETAQWRPILGDKAMPFANDGGGGQFFFDLSSTPASIKFCVNDPGFDIIDIVESFEAFIDGLYINPDCI
jgi:hypothetical protein